MKIKKRHIVFSIVIVLLGSFIINYVSVDRSVKALADGLIWQGMRWESTEYNYPVPSWDTTFLATDGDMGSIYGFGHDSDYTYLRRDSLLDNYLYVRLGYKRKTSGTLTAIAMRDIAYPVTSKRKEIRSILTQSLSNHYRCQFVDFRDMSSVRFSYNQSRVADFLFGWITYDGEFWYFIPKSNEMNHKPRGEEKSKVIDCYQIDKQYSQLFNEFKYLYSWHSTARNRKPIKATLLEL